MAGWDWFIRTQEGWKPVDTLRTADGECQVAQVQIRAPSLLCDVASAAVLCEVKWRDAEAWLGAQMLISNWESCGGRCGGKAKGGHPPPGACWLGGRNLKGQVGPEVVLEES